MIATLAELQARLDWELDEQEKIIAQSALDDLTIDAQGIGLSRWTTEDNTPPKVKRLILKAAARYMKNPSGYILSRAGQEQLNWSDRGDAMGEAEFNDSEKADLAALAGKVAGSIQSVRMRSWPMPAATPFEYWRWHG